MPVTKTKEEIVAEMNAAATVAAEDLKKVPENARAAIKGWFEKHYLKAGYKRLGKVLLGKPFTK